MFRWVYKHDCVVLDLCTFLNLSYKSNRTLFPCLHSVILILGRLGEFSKVMQTLDHISGLLNSSNPLVFRWGYVNTEKVLYCLKIWLRKLLHFDCVITAYLVHSCSVTQSLSSLYQNFLGLICWLFSDPLLVYM